MQGANKGIGKLPKKLKLAANETTLEPINELTTEPTTEPTILKSINQSTTDESTTDEPITEPTTLESINESTTDESSTEPATLESNESVIVKPHIIEPLETLGEGIHRQGTNEVVTRPVVVTSIEGNETTIGKAVEGVFHIITHADGITILDEHFPKSPVESRPLNSAVAHNELLTTTANPNAVSSEATGIFDPGQAIGGFEMSKSTSNTGSLESLSSSTDLTSNLSSETDVAVIDLPDAAKHSPLVRRSILDDFAQWLEHVLVALESVCDYSRIPNSLGPGVLDAMLTTTDYTNFVRIITSVTENWAKCNRLIARTALDAAKERLREAERLYRIQADQYRINMTKEGRAESQRLKQAVECLDIRELSRMALQDLLSEPAELIGEFSEESDYENAMKYIENEDADETRDKMRALKRETYLWPLIQQRAKKIGPLPKSSGRKTEITSQEKSAAKTLTVTKGYGKSRNCVFKWTSYWKLLSELRRSNGTTPFVLCRTNEFKNYFFQHPKKLDILLSWNKAYDFPLRQLRLRVIAEEGDDFSGKSDIEEKWLRDRLHAPQNVCWGDHLSAWDQDSTEYETFLADHSLIPTSTKSNIHILRYGIKGELDRNKSIFISFVPYEGDSDKETTRNKTASTKLLTVAPLVAVAPGDFLGIFPGRLRYTNQKPTTAIRGPVSNLWLDYSEVRGKLNKIKVAKAGEMTNVCLAWEGVNEVKGDKSCCQYLRVLVIATRHIMPLDQLIRPPSGAGMLSGQDGRL